MIAAIVLTGGSGSRLGGVDKAALPFGDGTLLDHVLSVVDGCVPVVVVGPAKDVPGVVWTREEPPGGGPLAGLAAGLALVDAEFVVLLAVDQPGISKDTVRRLCAVGDNAVLFDGREQWLAGVWRTESVKAAMPDDPSGGALRRVLGTLNPVHVAARPGEARDVDTPEDLSNL